MNLTIEPHLFDLEAAWKLLQIVQSSQPNPLGTNWTRILLLEATRLGKSFVARNDSQLAGFCIFQDRTIAMELQLILVDPSLRRQGVARGLIQNASQAIGSNREIWLEVKAGNESAIQLYRCLGFEQVGTRPRYYSDGSSALLFTKR